MARTPRGNRRTEVPKRRTGQPGSLAGPLSSGPRPTSSFGGLTPYSEIEAEPVEGIYLGHAEGGQAGSDMRRLKGGGLLLVLASLLVTGVYVSFWLARSPITFAQSDFDDPLGVARNASSGGNSGSSVKVSGSHVPSRSLPQGLHNASTSPGSGTFSALVPETEDAGVATSTRNRTSPVAATPAPPAATPPVLHLKHAGAHRDAACRGGGSGQDDDPRMYMLATMVDSFEGCADLCRATPGCSGLEYGAWARCEVWVDEITGTAHAEGFTCFRTSQQAPAAAKRQSQGVRGHGSPLGEYGFLTDFNISASEARQRVRQMVRHFGVREFQLYDAMSSYSNPPAEDQEEWRTPCGGKTVQRSVIKAYVEEISASGGRSWLYVQAMGTDPGDVDAQAGFETEGTHNCGDVPLLDSVFPSAEWAEHIAGRWAAFASAMGFAGIHWDTLGPGGDLPAFLRAAEPLLRGRHLLQSCNFVGGKAWDDSLIHDRIVAFPYWEVWTVPDTLTRFIESSAHWHGGVLACYPGKSADHSDEMNNKRFGGVEPIDLLIGRWILARNHSMTYLAIGDGLRRAGMEYLPAAFPLEAWEIAKIQKAVFFPGEVEAIGGADTPVLGAADAPVQDTLSMFSEPSGPVPVPQGRVRVRGAIG